MKFRFRVFTAFLITPFLLLEAPRGVGVAQAAMGKSCCRAQRTSCCCDAGGTCGMCEKSAHSGKDSEPGLKVASLQSCPGPVQKNAPPGSGPKYDYSESPAQGSLLIQVALVCPASSVDPDSFSVAPETPPPRSSFTA